MPAIGSRPRRFQHEIDGICARASGIGTSDLKKRPLTVPASASDLNGGGLNATEFLFERVRFCAIEFELRAEPVQHDACDG